MSVASIFASVTVYLLEMYYVTPSACLCYLSFTILLFGSVVRCTCGWIFVTVYLLEMYYDMEVNYHKYQTALRFSRLLQQGIKHKGRGPTVIDLHVYVKPYHLPIIYYLVMG